MKILLVEDDPSTVEFLSAILMAHRYTVDVATDGQTGLELAILWSYDLILLDVELPKLDGVTLCHKLRSQGNNTPILILTAKGSNTDMVAGLDAGADDYVAKPCEPSQLLARIRALLRRGGDTPATTLTWGGLRLDPVAAKVTYQDQTVALRSKEYNLLELFLRHPQRVFSRSAILDHLWSADDFPTENAVTNLIKDLRQRLAKAGMSENLIETLYGLGYRLRVPPSGQFADDRGQEQNGRTDEAVRDVRDGQLDQGNVEAENGLFEQLAERFRASLDQRLVGLELAINGLQLGTLSQLQRQQAREEAHRLAGSLGMYGYTQASEFARAIEHELVRESALEECQSTHLTQLLANLKQAIVTPVLPCRPGDDPPPAASSTPPALVLVISEDDALAEALHQEATKWALQVETVPDWTESQQQLMPETPTVILLEFKAVAPDEAGLDVLRNLKQQFPAVPVMVLAEQDNLVNRVAASRLGSARYLTKSTSPDQIFKQVVQLLPQPATLQARVLLVDDDRLMHSIVTKLLQPWGLQITCLSEPEQFWNVLIKTDPDLLLLDVEMPMFNGIELCRVVRQDAKYGNLPILIVTAHTNMDYIQQVFAAGADDLISKPIVGPELVTRVISRIERWRHFAPGSSRVSA
ncbi:response regulator [Pantanalinema rosaneae CENA516]|uniref:response regulator n=1 Tax=Pantanalinema rosaneae TaxID=1620701 RepID=UPI003D6E57B4